MAKSEINKSGGTVTGGGMATAGLILGYVTIAIGLCLCLIWLAVWAGLMTLPFTVPLISTPSSY